jgi:endonuclease/exonuclease/phosphatase (EEP) superfamily protein YafD
VKTSEAPPLKRLWPTGLTTLTAVVAAATLIPLAARLWWVADLFSHFRWQFLALQLVLAPLLVAARRKGWLAVLAVPAALNAAVLLPYCFGSVATATGRGHVKLLAVNVRADNDRFAGLLEAIRREAPDVLLVVEYTPRWDEHLATLRAAYPYRVTIPRHDPFGIALYSRLPVEEAQARRLESTTAIDARLTGPAGPFRLIGVHLMPPVSAHRAAERNRQLAELARLRVRVDEPLIIAGDFNISPFSPYFSDWLARTRMQDSLAGRGPRMTWPSFFPVLGIAIDQCVVSRGFTVGARRELGGFGSDHYPVLVELTQT